MVKYNLSIKEDRKNELLKHIDLYGTVDGMANYNKKLYESILKYEKSLFLFVNDIGLEWKDVSKFTPTNFYKDFDNLKDKINQFIDKENRFPTKLEIIKELGIQQRNIDFHGGIFEIKRKMNYYSKNDLVDDNGFINRSLLEFKVSQFLIKNNISYKREQHPFPKEEGQFRSDFMIQTENNLIFHVELWGFSEKDGNGMTRGYNKKKVKKLKLYHKYNVNLISLEYDEMGRMNLTRLQEYLINKFSILSNYEFKMVNNEYLVSPQNLSDQEILDEIMKYSDKDEHLPTVKELSQNGLFHFVGEIRRRHDSYLSFAKKFNKTLIARKLEWDEDTVYSEMLKLIQYGLPLERSIFREYKLGGLTSFIKKSKKSIHHYKLNFYNKYLDEIEKIPDKEIFYLRNVSINKGSNIMNKVTPVQQEQAKQILEQYNSKLSS